MSDPNKPQTPPAFPAFGVTRAGEALDAAKLPQRPQTPPVDAARAAELMAGAPAPEPAPPATGPVLMMDDDFFGGMELADALAGATDLDVRSAGSDQKASALMDEETLSLAVLSVTTPGAPSVAADALRRGIPLAFVTPDGDGGPAARAFPDAVILRRGVDVDSLRAALAPLLNA